VSLHFAAAVFSRAAAAAAAFIIIPAAVAALLPPLLPSLSFLLLLPCCCCRRQPTEDPQLGWSFSHGVSIKRYCSGMGFILTFDVAKYVADNSANLYKGYPEDAVVGLWFAGTNFKTQHDMRLHDWVWKRCSNESIIIHKHDYKDVPEDGIMSSCFPDQKQP
jgi:hypothetical protein